MDYFSSITLKVWKKFEKVGEWELIPRAYHMIFAHIMGSQGLFFLLTGQIPWPHVIFGVALVYTSAIGVAAGAHRLWSHRSYKAKLPLRILLTIMQTFAGQGSLFCWARDHRLHHKYSETDADPHNIQRGIFFTHIGWTMLKEHPQVIENEQTIDFSDLHNDSVVAFQHKYFRLFDLILYHALPILIAYYLWLPSFYMCFSVNYLRFMLSYNVSSLGNSVAHTWIRKPYEKSIGPADVTWLSLLIIGEGWHNFHHIFPWDYRSTDIGLYICNLATMFIDLMARIGWAYDLKIVPDHVIRRRAARTGDGSHPYAHLEDNNKTASDCHCSKENNSLEENQDQTESDELIKNSTKDRDVNRNETRDESLTAIDKLDVGEIGPAPWGWGDNDIPHEDISETIIVKNSFREKVL